MISENHPPKTVCATRTRSGASPVARQPVLPAGLAPLRTRFNHHHQQSESRRLGRGLRRYRESPARSSTACCTIRSPSTPKGESFRLKEKLKAGLLRPKLETSSSE